MNRTPDEIKKGLECCQDYQSCTKYDQTQCPYYDVKECVDTLLSDALALIQQLEAERDAAVADMRQASIYLCCACKKYHHAVRGVSNHYCEVIGERSDFTGAISCGMFEWRGARKAE